MNEAKLHSKKTVKVNEKIDGCACQTLHDFSATRKYLRFPNEINVSKILFKGAFFCVVD